MDVIPKIAFSYQVGYEKDKFSSYDYQEYSGMGVRYKFVNTKKHKFSVYANILYAIDAIEESSTDTSYKDEYMSYKTKIVYSWQIIKNLKFK